jgi:hypothetical protein
MFLDPVYRTEGGGGGGHVRSDIFIPGGHKEMSSISRLTNSALVYEPNCGGMGGRVANEYSWAVHMEPVKTLEI